MKKVIQRSLPLTVMLLAAGVNCMAGPFMTMAQSVVGEAQGIVTIIAPIIVIGLGLSIAVSHERGVMKRVIAIIVGMVVMLGAPTFTSWFQSI